jgi:four helix bundle protein
VELDHQKLRVYALAREYRREVLALIRDLPRGYAGLRDQISRASLSVKLNIAEGSAEYAPAEKARFYRMARRSVVECSAVIDDLEDLGLLSPSATARAHELEYQLVAGLVKLIASTSTSDPAPKNARRPVQESTGKRPVRG